MDEMIEILKDIKVEKGVSKEPVKNSKSVHLQFESAIYDTMVINGMTYPVGIKDNVYWDITLHENGEVWYGGEYYQIRNSVKVDNNFALFAEISEKYSSAKIFAISLMGPEKRRP